MADWPDTPFKESMLKSNPVIVHCPEEALVSELFSIFVENGVWWRGGDSMSKTFWDVYRETTCYRVTRGHKLSYAETCDYDDYPSEYIKCTLDLKQLFLLLEGGN